MNIHLLKKKDFSLLMLGKLVSLIGTEMQDFALSLYVYKITGSATAFASVLALAVLPRLFLGPIAGVFVDWFDRKNIIVYLDILSGLLIGSSAIVYIINGGLTLLHVYALVVLLSIVSVMFNPAITTVIPTIMKKEELADANALNSFILHIGAFIAPVLAGILFGLYGLLVVLMINSISFILSAMSEFYINIPKVNSKPKKLDFSSFKGDFAEGIKFLINKKIIFTIVFLSMLANFSFVPVMSIGVIYISKTILKVSDYQYGLIQSVTVFGFILGPIIGSVIMKKFKESRIIVTYILLDGFILALLSLITTDFFINLFSSNIIPYIYLLVIAFLLALVTSTGSIAVNTVIQKVVPISIMGRVTAVMVAMTTAATPLGQMVFGVLFDKIDTWICIMIASLSLIFCIIVFKKSIYNHDSYIGEGSKNLIPMGKLH
ncbi:MFS transporter [Wukongibacter sp. M2B1]|uniref:MFS transporter n=1 Tax=Wukongibacter sp. M2B1 TaxID=3088895 RepID=UPI003D7B70F9